VSAPANHRRLADALSLESSPIHSGHGGAQRKRDVPPRISREPARLPSNVPLFCALFAFVLLSRFRSNVRVGARVGFGRLLH
jgi:hypothetical protein